jgi:hypothetical protein
MRISARCRQPTLSAAAWRRIHKPTDLLISEPPEIRFQVEIARATNVGLRDVSVTNAGKIVDHDYTESASLAVRMPELIKARLIAS